MSVIPREFGGGAFLAVLLAMMPLLVACPGGGGGSAGVTSVGRVENLTCIAPPRPIVPGGPGGGGIAQVALSRAFDGETFPGSLALVQHPTEDARWYVVRKSGEIDTFLETEPTSTRSLAVRVDVVTSGEMGLLGMAFHPEFASNGLVFLSYVRSGGSVGVSVIGRFVSDDDGLTFRPDGPAYEILTFDQLATNHNGGALAFSPVDGLLYAGFGDGGGANDVPGNAQNLNNLFGTIVRIDVDDEPYSIPLSNPFVGRAGLDEIWAYGFRNPWRFSFDRLTGDLWIGDVGQRSFEEVDRIDAGDDSGGNYGWPIKEANSCFMGSNCLGRTDLIDPIFEYGRSEGVSITGGFVYRGSNLTGRAGTYVFGDFGSGRIWGLEERNIGRPTVTELTGLPGQLVAFGESRAGELLVVDLGGRIYDLVEDGLLPPVDEFPRLLSETGCFDPGNPVQPMAGVIPYEIAAPFWSDGAGKDRFMAIPDDQTVSVAADGHFQFPVGSVLAKHFSMGSRMIETRLFIRHDDGDWAGYSYEWDALGRDAVLLEEAKEVDISGVDWLYPGRADCFRCHTESGGWSLGPEIAQMNFAIRHGDGVTENQVDRLLAQGILTAPLPNLGPGLDLMPVLTDASADVERRARAYLHSNCSYCHRPGGIGRGSMDLRFRTPTSSARICDEPPAHGDLGVAGARIVFPGEPNLSTLLLRMESLGNDRMPDFASGVVDQDAVSVVRDWIDDLDTCP